VARFGIGGSPGIAMTEQSDASVEERRGTRVSIQKFSGIDIIVSLELRWNSFAIADQLPGNLPRHRTVTALVS
jgi:hypothetical protein